MQLFDLSSATVSTVLLYTLWKWFSLHK
jgi:hypothetical protein